METRFGATRNRRTGPRSVGWLAVGATGITVIAALIALGSFGGLQTAQRAPTTTVSIPTPHHADPVETALAVVEEFAIAWNAGDAAGVDRLISGGWVSISLPGFADPSFRPDDGRSALRDALGFLVAVARVRLGSCDVEPAGDTSRAEVVVECPEALFEGEYLDAIRRSDRPSDEATVPGFWFGIAAGDIIAFDDGDPHRFSPEAYCAWAADRRELPVGLFDLSCRPVTHPDTAEAQAALAHAYAAAGSPIPDAATIGARLWAQSVTRFVGAFNAGDGARAADLLGPDVGAEDLPGYLGHTPGDPGPTPRDFLEWGAVVYTIDLGACGVALENAATTVSCPDLRLGGPLVAALGLDWAPQPTTFEVGFGTIGAIRSNEFGRNRSITGTITGEGDPAPATIDELCRRLRRERPSTAAQSFDGQCSPIYTGAAAAALVAVL